AHRTENPRAEIGDRDTDAHRPLARKPGNRHQPAHSLRNLVEAGTIGIRAVLAEARDAGVDKPRVDRAQNLVVDAQPMLDAGAIVLDQHVSTLDEPFEDFEPFGVFEVNGKATLVTMQVL